MFATVLTFTTIVLITVYYQYRWSRRRLYELAFKLPGPFDLPIIGSIHLGFRRGPTEILNYLIQFLHTVKTPMRAWVGPFLFVAVDQPEHLAVVMNSPHCVKRSYVYKFFGIEKGLFNAPPELWRKLRKQLNPSFSVANTKNFVPTFNEKADKLVSSLQCKVGPVMFDMIHMAGDYSLSSSMVNSLGIDLDNDNSDYKKRYLQNAERMFTLMWTRIYKAWLHPDFIYKLTSGYKEEKECYKMFQEMSRKVFEMRKAERLKNLEMSTVSPNRDEDNVRRNQIFIQNLEQIAAETDILDEEGVIQNLDTFIFASNDTTASAISTTLLLLAMHPEVQERLYQEITEALPRDYIDYEDLSKLVYLEMVIKESMRLIPAGAAIARVCEKEIQVGGYTIPANSQIVIPILKVHRDKNIWGERSEQFDPEHFSPENCAKRHPYAFLGFSAGIRNCIGVKYSLVNLKIVLAKLVKNYRFSTDLKLADLKFVASIVMKIANGYMIRIEQRTGKVSHT
ncbi:probable cytochrome P450 313a4 [Wyeomyia smithii]|uniref:probable cytochrome P450 313a4 n=1 Tax=Wyeomyia smithii TaxID=174621 RepID=UPI002467DCFD|nr:probable cytochrome P450 313a4 [Wyeomyia smithii]